MKKLVTLFLGLFLTVSLISAQQYWNQYLIDQNFNGLVALPNGWSFLSASSSSTTAVFGRSGGANYPDAIRISGSGSGNRGGEIKFPLTPDSSTIYVEMDLLVAKSTVNYRNTFQFYLLGSKSVNLWNTGTPYADVIAGIYWVGSSGKFHIWNKDINGPVPVEKPDSVIPVFTTGQYPTFQRAGTSTAITDSLNLKTKTDLARLYNVWYTLKFKLDFSTKKMDLTISQRDSAQYTQTFTDLKFVSPTVNDFVSFGTVNNRNSNQGNASNADLDMTVDNFKVYQKVKSLGRTNVTINYTDTEGNPVKESRIAAEQEIGLKFGLSATDKETFTKNNNYYAYDAASTGKDSVLVVEGGVSITVKFKKTPVTVGTYTWSGNVSENWNEVEENFTTDGTNQIGYQNGNAVRFASENALFKNVLINSVINTGAGSLDIDAKGYVLSGAGALVGTGDINVNTSTKLGFINNMSGNLNLKKDTLTVTNERIAKKYIVSNGTALAPTTSISTPITGSGSFTLIPSVNTYNSRIDDLSEVNYALKVKGNLTAMTGMPRMICVLDTLTKLNVYSQTGDSVVFDSSIPYKLNAISLGDNVLMTYSTNPSNQNTTIVEIGELSGTKTSSLVGNKVYRMTYQIGGLNTNAVFAGEFNAIKKDAWSNRTDYDLAKVGKGKWTLNGSSPKFFGNVKVLDGTLEVNDTLCNATGEYVFGTTTLTTVPNKIAEVMVADTAILTGKGYIGATSTVLNGTITGNLTLAGSLSMKAASGDNVGAKTVINVTSTAVDKIKVVGDLYYGGKLKINVISLPQPGDYQILEFGGFLESGPNGFDSIELPSENWTFDYTTGILKYKGGDESAVNTIDYTKQIESIRYFDITGKQVTKNHIGFVFMKVKYTDGTTASVKTFVKK